MNKVFPPPHSFISPFFKTSKLDYRLPRWLSVKKNPPANARHASSIPGSGRSPGEGNCNPLQYSCLGIPMDREAWQATAHRIAESDRIWQLSTHKLDYTISKSFSGSEPHCVCFKVEAMRNQEAPSRRAGSSYSCLDSAPAACGD